MSHTNDDGFGLSKIPKQAGYKNPPMKGRFKQSGNINGRPKGSKNRKTIMNEIANEKHTIHETGKPVQRSVLELIMLQLRKQALEGQNLRAFEEMHRLIKFNTPEAADDNVGYLVVPASISELAWVRRAENDNRFSTSPEEKSDRANKIIENYPEISEAQAQGQVEEELKAEKLKTLETEKLKRAEEFRKVDPTLDIDESIRRAEAAWRDWLNGE